MAHVHIPALLRDATQGREWVEMDGRTVREVVESLVSHYPALRDRLVRVSDGRLTPGVAVAIDGEISSMGLAETVDSGTEIQFLSAIQGG